MFNLAINIIFLMHCLLTGSEIYQETLAKALAKYFGVRLLIVDSLLLPGVSLLLPNLYCCFCMLSFVKHDKFIESCKGHLC